MSTRRKNIKDICIIAIFFVILFAQEELLTFLPNIQLTIFLIIIYSKIFGFKKTIIIVTIYLLLDCVFMASLNPIFMLFQLIGWMLIPIGICTIFRKIDDNIILSFIAIVFSLLYCWIMAIPSVMLLGIDFKTYFLGDIIFELVLSLSSFLTTLLLYNPLKKIFIKFYNH